MTYATQAQLSDRYGDELLIRLTDRGATATGAIDTAVIDRALADTDATIDGYLAARYALPLAATPELIVDLAQAIAIYKLHVFDPDPKIEADYREAMKTLRDIGQGVVRLTVAGVDADGTGASGARITDRDRPFTEDNLTGFI